MDMFLCEFHITIKMSKARARIIKGEEDDFCLHILNLRCPYDSDSQVWSPKEK